MTMHQPAPRLPVSVCLIAGNEARRIRRTLDSVAGWTSEIVVVLNEDVTDGTDKIALEFGAHVFREPWKGYVAQKNSVAAKATQPWLLNLDADEVVSPELCAEIQRLFSESEQLQRFAAFSFPRLSWYCGRWIRHGDWYPDRCTRLWRRERAEWQGGCIHEKLCVDGVTGKLHADLHHFSRESINAHLAKIVPFSDEFVKQYGTTGQKQGVLNLAIRPFWRFFRAYIIRLGFLDGWQGYYIASHNAFATLARYAKVCEARSREESTG